MTRDKKRAGTESSGNAGKKRKVSKVGRERDAGSGGSGDKVENKKPKVDLKVEDSNSFSRPWLQCKWHVKQLQSLLALMSVSTNPFQVTDNMAEVLERPDSSIGLYFEWERKEDRCFFWGSVTEEKLWIKFEFDGGFREYLDLPNLKNPVLAFSQAFACDGLWGEVKQWLEELFGHPNEEESSGTNDFLLAFTRTGMFLHFRIFKILKSSDMDVEEVSPAFILKPLEIHRPTETENGSKSYRKANVFLDEERFLLERKCNLSSVASSSNDRSCGILIPHIMQLSDSVLLPLPSRNSQWFGFNTSCEEFFERYHILQKRHVPGTGPDPNPPPVVGTPPVGTAATPGQKMTKSQRRKRKQVAANPDPTPLAAIAVEHEQLTVAMKVFCRGLIKHVLDILKSGSCLSDVKQENIFMRGGRLVILGVNLLPYLDDQARENCGAVHNIITQRLDQAQVPADVCAALVLLKGKDPISSYDLIVNSVAWMIAIERSHMVFDLHEDFTEHLLPDMQVQAMSDIDGIGTWFDKFKNNWLIYANQAFGMPKKALSSDQGLSKHLEQKAIDLQSKPEDPKMDVLSPPNSHLGVDLLTGRMYFGGIRHLYAHLSASARKFKKMDGMSDELKDFVISSEFAAALQTIQVHVPAAFSGSKDPKDTKRASYRRFKQYFCCAENIEFDSGDEK
ncbi:hypothetical protein ACP4OV_024074 [Aristida adscensionis]